VDLVYYQQLAKHRYRTLLDEDARGKTVVEIPHVDGRDTTLKVHLTVGIKGFVGLDLNLTELVRRGGSITERGAVLVGPG